MNILKSKILAAYTYGNAAARRGVQIDLNPYCKKPSKYLHLAWANGWKKFDSEKVLEMKDREIDKAVELRTDQLLENGEPKSDFKPEPLLDRFLSESDDIVWENWVGDALVDFSDISSTIIKGNLRHYNLLTDYLGEETNISRAIDWDRKREVVAKDFGHYMAQMVIEYIKKADAEGKG